MMGTEWLFNGLREAGRLLKEALTENGKGSYSRFTGAAIVFATLGWITYLVIRNKALPDLGGATMFISVGAGTHYAINQVKAVAQAMRGNGEGNAN
jgi:hypothetical protein